MSATAPLRKFVLPEFVFGDDARLLCGRYAKNLHMHRVLLISDPTIAQYGWAQEISAILQANDLETILFQDITPNPRDFEIMTGNRMFQDHQCDGIVAIGGGSVIDAAKGIGIVASNGGHILDYEGVDKIPLPMPPLIAIPTTAGTAADISQFTIVNDQRRRVKTAIISKATLADVALVDPRTLDTMPSVLAACTGLDALTHAIEAFVSNASSPITDNHAMFAMDLIWKNLRASVRVRSDSAAHANMMLASLSAGMAFSNASLGSVHAMAHSLGGYLDLPHGECNALLLPHVIRFNYSAAEQRYQQIARLWNLPVDATPPDKRCDLLVDAIVELRRQVGIDWSLSKHGLRITDIAELAHLAFLDPCNATNPRRPHQDDLAAIFREAL